MSSNNSANFDFTANSWTGTNGSGWNTASNWTCNVLPSSVVDVIIPVVSAPAVYPVVTGSDNLVRSLTIQSGATVTVQGTLKISGELINNGSFDLTAGTLELNGTTVQTLPAFANTVQNLVVSNDVTLGGTMSLTGTLSFGTVNNKTLNTNGFLTLKSSADTTARVADLTNGGTNAGNEIVGNVTAERYVPSKTARKWTYVTVPVTGNTIKQAWQNDVFITGPGDGGAVCGTQNDNGFDVTIAKAPSMFTYNATQVNGSRWVPIPNTFMTLQPGTGYRINIRGPRGVNDANCQQQLNSQTPPAPSSVVLDATGSLVQSAVPVALNAPATHLYTLIGNPYASEISFPSFRAANASAINDKYWTYTPFNSFNTFATYNAGTAVNFPAGVNTNLLASGQAFFVEAASPSATPQVIFQEQHKAIGNKGNAMFRVMNWVEKVRVKYTDGTNSQLDEIVIRFGDDAEITTAVNKYDAISFNGGDYLASRKGTSRFAIQTRPIGYTTDMVPLTVTAATAGTYQLQFSEFENMVSAQVIELVDAYTGTTTDIRTQSTYSFEVDANAASKGDSRFQLVFKKGNSLPVRSLNLTAERKQQKVQLNWSVTGEDNMNRYEVERSADGQSFKNIGSVNATGNNNSAVSYTYTDQQPLDGTAYYRIQARGHNGEVSYSAIVKLKAGNSVTVQLYPNPVKDKLNLVVANADAASYDLQVLNVHGAQVIRQNGVIVQNGVVTLNTKALSAGMYTLRLSNAAGEIITELFVKQ